MTGAGKAPPVWVDGALVAPDEARVSPFDHGITVGDGVFETLRVYDGTPFALRRHLDRLDRSAKGLGLVLPDRSLLERAVAEVVEASGMSSSRVRITITGGESPLGSDRGTAAPTVIAAVGELGAIGPTVDVAVVPWVRNERGALAGMKTTSYGENVVALAYAHERDAGEAIFANTRGELCEGTGTNVFVVSGGRLLTPPLSSGCLAGITRELVLDVVEVEEANLPLSALAGADEAFLTSSTREVHPIARVDGRALPAAPGPVTARAAEAFSALVAEGLDP